MGINPMGSLRVPTGRLTEQEDVSEAAMLSIMGHLSRKMLDNHSHIRMRAKRAAVARPRTLIAARKQRTAEMRKIHAELRHWKRLQSAPNNPPDQSLYGDQEPTRIADQTPGV